MKASDIKPAITQEKYAEIMQAIDRANKPFVDALVELYACYPSAGIVYFDGETNSPRFEPIDIYERLPEDVRQHVDETKKLMQQTQEYVLREYGIQDSLNIKKS